MAQELAVIDIGEDCASDGILPLFERFTLFWTMAMIMYEVANGNGKACASTVKTAPAPAVTLIKIRERGHLAASSRAMSLPA